MRPADRLKLLADSGALWSFPGSSLDLDFQNSRAALNRQPASLTSLLAISRASTGLAQRLDGTFQSFASGALRITDQGLLIEEARTNLFLNSAAAVTQTIIIGATGSYTITCWGTSSDTVVVAAGTATITGAGTATGAGTGGSVTINVTVTGTITCTVSGSPVYVNVEAGAFKTSPIITAGASATRLADIITLQGAALTAALNAHAAFTQTMGVTGGVNNRLLIGSGIDIYYPNSTFVRITIGSTTQTVIGQNGTTAGTVKSAFGFDSSTATVRANGSSLASGSGTWPAFPSLTIGSNAGSSSLNGFDQRLVFSATKGIYDGSTAL